MANFVDLAINKQANDFRVELEYAMAEKVQAALDAKRAEVASTMFTTPVTETLAPNASASDYIEDFVKSDDPRFAGNSKKKRIQRALAAYYKNHK